MILLGNPFPSADEVGSSASGPCIALRAGADGAVRVAVHRDGAHPDWMNAGLRAELLRRAERDQAARQASDEDALDRVDAENLPWLRKVITETGWPGRSIVGEDGANAAWLLAQHADGDPAFQRQCLDLLTVAAGQGEATKAQLAFLTDRVLLAEGKPQEFGTQAIGRKGQWVPRSLRDPGHVGQSRAAMSLGPLAENLARITEQYGPPPPWVTACPACGAKIEFWQPDPGEEVTVDCANCRHALRMIGTPSLPYARDDLGGHDRRTC